MQLIDILKTLPTWVYIVDLLALMIIAGVGIWTGVYILLLRARLMHVVAEPESVSDLLTSRYSRRTLLRYSGLVEKIGRKYSPKLPVECGLTEAWVHRLLTAPSTSELQKLLEFAPETALVGYLILSLDRAPSKDDPLHQELVEYLNGGSLNLGTAAHYCDGRDFDGKIAAVLLHQRTAEIGELFGSICWRERFFAYSILVHFESSRFRRTAWDGFTDPHPAVRIVACKDVENPERGKVFESLLGTLYDDPVYEVRRAAKTRITRDFAEAFDPPLDALEKHQVLHILELLDPESKEDENIALKYLGDEDLELRMTAAIHLDRCGALHRLFSFNDVGDKQGLERNFQYLLKACEVNVCSFLDSIRETTNPASLFIAARLLRTFGDTGLIDALSRIVLEMPEEIKTKRDFVPVYRATLQAIHTRGGDAAFNLLNEELIRNASNGEAVSLLLQFIPGRGEAIFSKTLLGFMKIPDFPAKDSLRAAMVHIPHHRLIPEILQIVKAPIDVKHTSQSSSPEPSVTVRGLHRFLVRRRPEPVPSPKDLSQPYPLPVRRLALQILGDLKKPYCIQTVLERISLLTVEQANEFTAVLAEFAGKEFDSRLERLLESCDSGLRARLIASLPVTRRKQFVDTLQTTLEDSDPEIRIASAWALSEYGDSQLTDTVYPLLRDPHEEVRIAAARIIAERGSAKTTAKIQEMIDDPTETDDVKISAIRGLGLSNSTTAVEVLVHTLDQHPALRPETIDSLASKTTEDDISATAERYLQAPPEIRDLIGQSFARMGEPGETVIKVLLASKKGKQRIELAAILEQTGYVERRTKALMHRSAEVRREAAADLAHVGTEAAYRGIIQAIKDPDQEVRVRVVHAVEALGSSQGKQILSALQQDPDKRVRKHTHWAVERILAKTP
jgi:HEAT repeat protein